MTGSPSEFDEPLHGRSWAGVVEPVRGRFSETLTHTEEQRMDERIERLERAIERLFVIAVANADDQQTYHDASATLHIGHNEKCVAQRKLAGELIQGHAELVKSAVDEWRSGAPGR
jgi:hypothetical protein